MIVTKVIKRDGRKVEFDINRIKNVIEKAFIGVGKFYTKGDIDSILNKVINNIYELANSEEIHVEFIQDCVERALMRTLHYDVAKAFIIYRKNRAELRNIIKDIIRIVDDYIYDKDWRIKENSNMGYSLQGLNNFLTTNLISNYWLEKIYPEKIKYAHIDGDIHIHDLGVLGAYCCGWDLRDLLLNGFTGVEGKVSSKPPKHFRTALLQIVNFFYTLQGEAAGAQAFSNVSTLLAPFIYYDRLTYEQVKQAMQEFIFNLNVPTRVGFQSPFTNITLDLTPSEVYKDEPVIIGGQLMDRTYKEFQREIDMFNMAFAEVMMEGDASGRIFSFPIPTYNITKDLDWDSPVVKKIMQMTAKYGIPFFANFLHSTLKPDDVMSMCCRLRLDKTELIKRGGGLFGANPLTGSIGVVTINLPRIGYLSKTEDEYFERLGELMNIAKESLVLKREVIEKLTEQGLYPYAKFYLRNVHKRFGQYWANHFNTIGIIGMHESLLNFMGVGIYTEEGQKFAKKVLKFMNDRLIEYQKETGLLFNLEATPAEGTSYRLAKIDKAKYENIITSGIEEPFYTNSTQLPVDFTEDIFTALDLQDELQCMYTGGTVFHVYIGEKLEPETAQVLLRKIVENYKLPYISLTPTFSICQNHGYISGEHYTCPTCGKECEVYSRVVGYYRPVKNWNNGKQEEFKNRKYYKTCIKR